MEGRKHHLRLIAVVALGFAVAIPAGAHARTLYATTAAGKLISFADKATKLKSAAQGKGGAKKPKKAPKAVQAKTSRTIAGLPGGVSLVGIDFRPKTGELLGIGSNSVVYRLLLNESSTARALQVGAPLTTAVAGSSFGVDFNPIPDAIRIVSNASQNLRITGLNTVMAGATTLTTNVDGALNPGAPSIVGAGYSNSGFSDQQPGAGTTTLFTVDSTADTLNTQGSPGGAPTNPNTGTQLPVGPLGVELGTMVGFDLVGSFGAPSGLLTNAAGGETSLYEVNLATGATDRVGEVVRLKKGRPKEVTLTGLAAVQD